MALLSWKALTHVRFREKLQMHQDDTRIQVDFQNAQLICSYETTVKLLRSEKEKS